MELPSLVACAASGALTAAGSAAPGLAWGGLCEACGWLIDAVLLACFVLAALGVVLKTAAGVCLVIRAVFGGEPGSVAARRAAWNAAVF